MSTLIIFDMDDTLFHSNARVNVINAEGKIVRRLSSAQYNTDKLQKDEKYDFSEFSSSDIFYNTAQPIRTMLAKFKAILKAIENNTDTTVIIVTARADFDNKTRFLDTFRKFGIDIDKVYVERSGNVGSDHATSSAKVRVFNKYLRTGRYTKAILYDDNAANIRGFLGMSKYFKDTIFLGYLVQGDGSSSQYTGA